MLGLNYFDGAAWLQKVKDHISPLQLGHTFCCVHQVRTQSKWKKCLQPSRMQGCACSNSSRQIVHLGNKEVTPLECRGRSRTRSDRAARTSGKVVPWRRCRFFPQAPWVPSLQSPYLVGHVVDVDIITFLLVHHFTQLLAECLEVLPQLPDDRIVESLTLLDLLFERINPLLLLICRLNQRLLLCLKSCESLLMRCQFLYDKRVTCCSTSIFLARERC